MAPFHRLEITKHKRTPSDFEQPYSAQVGSDVLAVAGDLSGEFHCTGRALLVVTATDFVNSQSPEPQPEVNFGSRG